MFPGYTGARKKSSFDQYFQVTTTSTTKHVVQDMQEKQEMQEKLLMYLVPPQDAFHGFQVHLQSNRKKG